MNHTIYSKDKTEKKLLTPSLRALAKRAVKMALEYEAFEKAAEVSFTAVDRDEIHALNAEWRGVDRETDVLSFPALDEDDFSCGENDTVVLGDIILCMDKCFEQAEEFGHSAEREAAYLTVHSLLHLLGYDHEKEDEEKEMSRRCGEIVALLGL